MALWAPLMEKAYARLSEKNNQYGGFRTGNQVNSTGGGYEQIDGGFERWVYGIFYGPDLNRVAKVDVHHRPGEDLVLQNPATIQTLLYHQGYRATRGATPTAATHVMVSASISDSEAVKRLIATIDHCSALPQMRRYRSLKTILEQIKGLAATYQGRVNAGASNAIQGAAMNRLSAGCERQVASGVWPMLEDPNSDKIWHDLHESLAIVGNLGTDSSNGTRNIYANHAYPVVGVEFLGHDGRPFTLNVDSLATDLANVSGENSRVVLRNPHQTNEPNLPSSMVDHNTEDGIFKMSLDAYLRAFSAQEMAHVKDT